MFLRINQHAFKRSQQSLLLHASGLGRCVDRGGVSLRQVQRVAWLVDDCIVACQVDGVLRAEHCSKHTARAVSV